MAKTAPSPFAEHENSRIILIIDDRTTSYPHERLPPQMNGSGMEICTTEIDRPGGSLLLVLLSSLLLQLNSILVCYYFFIFTYSCISHFSAENESETYLWKHQINHWMRCQSSRSRLNKFRERHLRCIWIDLSLSETISKYFANITSVPWHCNSKKKIKTAVSRRSLFSVGSYFILKQQQTQTQHK